MIKARLREFLIQPGFISLIILVALLLFAHPRFSKYRVKQISEEYLPTKTYYFFSDLDSDGNSEKISFDLNDVKQTKIIISKGHKILDQYDLKYQSPGGSLTGGNSIYTGDYNNDGNKECYIFTASQDSVFLNIIDPVRLRKIILNSRFIDFTQKAQNSTDVPYVQPVELIVDKNRPCRDLLFYINTGYSLQPRNIYRYLIDKDSLKKSPENGAVIAGCTVADLNFDSIPEIIPDISAPGNLEENFPYTDHYSWLMVLDNNLRFRFPPVRFGKNPSKIQVLPLAFENHTVLVVYFDYFGSNDIKSYFCLYGIDGNKIKEQSVEEQEQIVSSILINQDTRKGTFYFLKNRKSEIVEMDTTFQIINNLKIPEIKNGYPLATIDADLDRKKEIIFYGIDNRSIVIVQNDFKYPVSYQYSKDASSVSLSQFLRTGAKPALFVQERDHGMYIRFEKNPYFRLKYPFYMVLYLAIFFFISLIARIQLYRLQLKRETERKLVLLQMKAIKNQVDPHFTLNVLNAIGSLYANIGDRDKADYIFGKYARLIRQTVISSDQVSVTLTEEIDFVRNYVEIEQFRCNDSFGYSINIDKNVDMQTKIPRMLIHTFVENALKYGIRNKPEDGFLAISIQTNASTYLIIVEDNGPGLQPDIDSGQGTKKGLIILNELIDLYARLERLKITYSLQNIPGTGEVPAGTRAVIRIPVRTPLH